jgi:hypothetical protein
MKGFGKGGMSGALGGLLGRGPKMSPRAMAELAEMGAGGGDLPIFAGMGGESGALGAGPMTPAGLGVGGAPRGSSKSKGKGGKKGKGGGRVTPKAR